MINPFEKADFIRLGHDEIKGFWISIENINANLIIYAGPAAMAATIMKTNGVRYFDYDSSVSNDECLLEEFVERAKWVGFEI